MSGIAAPITKGMKFSADKRYVKNIKTGYVTVEDEFTAKDNEFHTFIPKEFRKDDPAVVQENISDDVLEKMYNDRIVNKKKPGTPKETGAETPESEVEVVPEEENKPEFPPKENPGKMRNAVLIANLEELKVEIKEGWKRSDYIKAYLDFYAKAEKG